MWKNLIILIFPESKPKNRTFQGEVTATELLYQEMFFCTTDAQRTKQAVVFQRLEFIFGDDMIRLGNNEAVALMLETEEYLQVAIVDVSDLQHVILYAPIDGAVGHVARTIGGKRVNLTQLPVGV